MSVPASLITTSAVLTSMPSMRVRSKPQTLKSWVRRSNLGALRVCPRLAILVGAP